MVRQATPADASRLAEILVFGKRTAYRHIFNNDHVSFNELQVLSLALHYQNTAGALQGLFVYDDGIVKGLLHATRPGNMPALQLQQLYVDPFFQGQGIGRHLMQDFLQRAEDAHARSVFLWVLEENTHACRFYQSFGFIPSGKRKPEGDTEHHTIQLVKTL